jgi:microcin C transport system substrate-binding protein
LPLAVFGEPYTPPVTDASGRFRPSIRTASRLLDEAGWTLQDGVRKNAKGEPLEIEFLIDDPVTERILGPYTGKLTDLGLKASLRRIDATEQQERLRRFEFDVVTERYSLSPTPGPEVRAYWSTEASQQDGSYNLSGIADPVVDALIGKILAAKSRDELRTACHAIDRVLRAAHYWVPEWFKSVHNIAAWAKYASIRGGSIRRRLQSSAARRSCGRPTGPPSARAESYRALPLSFGRVCCKSTRGLPHLRSSHARTHL